MTFEATVQRGPSHLGGLAGPVAARSRLYTSIPFSDSAIPEAVSARRYLGNASEQPNTRAETCFQARTKRHGREAMPRTLCSFDRDYTARSIASKTRESRCQPQDARERVRWATRRERERGASQPEY